MNYGCLNYVMKKYNSLRGFNKPLLKEHGSYHE